MPAPVVIPAAAASVVVIVVIVVVEVLSCSLRFRLFGSFLRRQDGISVRRYKLNCPGEKHEVTPREKEGSFVFCIAGSW